jgi:PAS domain S-box-containing protein
MNNPSVVPGRRVHALLSAWRAAERQRIDLPPEAEAYRDAGIDAVRAWLDYQLEVAPTDEVILVADDDRRYVAATGNVTALLGYQPAELMGRLIDELAAPELVPATPSRWERFVKATGEADRFRLVARDGSHVEVEYEARADYPVPGFHVSRLRPPGHPHRAG